MNALSFSPTPQNFLQHPMLQTFLPEQYRKDLKLVHFQEGQAICHQDQELTVLTFVLEGKVKVVRKLFNGKEYILGIQGAPTLIGDIELLTGQTVVSSVIAIDETWCAQLPLLNKEALLADPLFLYRVGQGLATSLYQQNIQAAVNVGYSVKERLASHILSIEHDGYFQLELHILADSFGTSYRHLLRTIKELLTDGAIEKRGKSYFICQASQLENLRIHQ